MHSRGTHSNEEQLRVTGTVTGIRRDKAMEISDERYEGDGVHSVIGIPSATAHAMTQHNERN